MTKIEYILNDNYNIQCRNRLSYTIKNISLNIYWILFITSLEGQDDSANRYKVKNNFNESDGVHQRFAQLKLDNTASNKMLSSSNDETFSSG